MRRYELADFPELAGTLRRPYHAGYFAMYSSVYGGIVTDPVLMLLPMDDHLAHRGDGIFEVFKCVGGALYNLGDHLDRLEESARGLQLGLPVARRELERTVVETVRAGERRDCTVRVFVSRGPGGFSVNPYECPAPQLYVVVGALGEPFMQLHPGGARVRRSAVPAKTGTMAVIKSCNYAPNALMKKEAVDAGVDFVAGFDEHDHLTEGATENLGIVSADGRLLFPRPEHILHGTTMRRVMDLAREHLRGRAVADVGWADIGREDMVAARELLITGTTVNVAAGVEFDGRPVGDGRPGPVWRELSVLLERDMRSNTARLTRVWA
jgi:branched-chain amino acid aminotransferase